MLRLGQRGIALVKVLFFTSILLAVAAYAARSTRVEVVVARNDYLQKQALQIAEAGLDRAWRKVQADLNTVGLDTELANPTSFLGTGSDDTYGGVTYRLVSFGSGQYRVRLENNSDESSTPTDDTDGKIAIRSIGTAGGATRDLEGVLAQSHAFDEGIFGKYGVTISGTGSDRVATDSYNSSLGDYSSQTPGTAGDVGSNGDISNNGQPEVHGSATAGGTVDLTPDATGGETSGAPQKALPPVPPCNTNPTIGGYTTGTLITANSIRSNSNVTLPRVGDLPPYVYCLNNIDLGSHASLIVTQPVVIYTTGYIDVSGQGFVNQNSPPVPSTLQIYSSCVGNCGGPGAGIKLTGGSDAAFVLYAPEANVKFASNTGDIYGAVIGGTIDMNGGVDFHYDEALDGTGPTVTSLVTWRENRS